MMESSVVEGEEYYNPEGSEWTQKVENGQLCRVCASANEYLIPIFDGEGLEHELGMKIQKHLPIKVTETDNLPQQMCYQCASTLIAWHDLVISCVEADKKLRELQVEGEEDDYDDKGAEVFETPSLDSEMTDDVQASTSETQNQVSKIKSPKKTAVSKEKKPNLKMVLVKGPPPGSSGQKTASKTQVAKALELAKSKDSANQDSASERYHPSPLTSFRAFLDTQNPWRTQHRNENVFDLSHATSVLIKTEDHTLENGLGCCYCGVYFNSNSELSVHLSVAHSSKVFHCNTCDAIFYDNKEHFLDHMNTHDQQHDSWSDIAGKNDISVPNLMDIVSVDTEPTVPASNVHKQSVRKKSYPCTVCGSILSRSFDLKRHMRIHKPHEKENGSKGMKFHCSYCNKILSRKFDMRKHVLAVHSFKTSEETLINERSCSASKTDSELPIKVELPIETEGAGVVSEETKQLKQCKKNNVDSNHKKEQDNISRAKVELNGRTVYRCDQCNKHIVTRYSYIRHLRIHTGEKPYTCHVCGKQFRVQALLSRHVREVHDRIKNHPCDICGRRFANSNARNDHRRTHTGERPCVCHLCGKAFKTKASLFVHNKFHSDVFPHPCPQCDKRFRRRQQLNIHILHHTGEKPHTCHFCGKSFRLSKTLKDHTLIHTNKETFECIICGKYFAQERYLKNHARNHRLRVTSRNLVAN
ncbi:zinc finger protein 260 isoform X6 [Cryptotermes secundus]|uniref:zinc finger protein 260 isoform X6 n=1 Tax=Cryptotermes secundus TaxID=105785 RepID=UPI000CD7CFC3|nr:zinc finger protein 260 isoform X6 [Cryptotermes secundus]